MTSIYNIKMIVDAVDDAVENDSIDQRPRVTASLAYALCLSIRSRLDAEQVLALAAAGRFLAGSQGGDHIAWLHRYAAKIQPEVESTLGKDQLVRNRLIWST